MIPDMPPGSAGQCAGLLGDLLPEEYRWEQGHGRRYFHVHRASVIIVPLLASGIAHLMTLEPLLWKPKDQGNKGTRDRETKRPRCGRIGDPTLHSPFSPTVALPLWSTIVISVGGGWILYSILRTVILLGISLVVNTTCG